MSQTAQMKQQTAPVVSDVCRSRSGQHRQWVRDAIATLHASSNACEETPLIKLDLPLEYVDIYLKDESAHPSGSLKHRLAKSLFLWGLSSGRICPETTIIECSSGSTAISEAYFAKRLGLKFIAVVPETTAPEKIRQIELHGGQCERVPASAIYETARRIAQENNGHFMDQFTYAEQATDWRSSDNIAASILNQLEGEPCPVPDWIVVGAGTGGTSTTIGRYLTYVRPDVETELCVVDPENSVLFDHYTTGDYSLTCNTSSRIEGIGRPRVEPSFFRELVDRMIKVPDTRSIAAIHYLAEQTGRKFGASTGTNFVGAMTLAKELEAKQKRSSIVSLICDDGERYAETYYNPDWLQQKDLKNIEGFEI